MAERRKQSLLSGAVVLAVSAIVVKVMGLIYKIPLTALIGEVGRGYFSAAYNIFTPIYAVSMAGLPVAVTGMVSRNMALGRYKQTKKIFGAALAMFSFTGIAGTALLLLLAYPYSFWLIRSPETFKSIVMIAPSVLFCCVMAAYRAYFEGLGNMIPTALSEVVESFTKMGFGILLAFLVMRCGMESFNSSGTVFGAQAASRQEAESLLFPWTAAAAVAGVSIGSFFGCVYLFIYKRIKGNVFTRTELINSPLPSKSREIAGDMIKFSLPVMTGAVILNITNFIDAVTVQNRLSAAVLRSADTVKNMYSAALTASGTLDKDISVYLYGVYGAVMDFRSLIPTVTMTLGISAIPVLSAAWAVKNRRGIERTVTQVIRITMLIAVPAGFGMAVLAEPLLSLIYGGTRSENMVSIAAPILAAYGVMTPVMAISAPVTHMLQAIGKTQVPVKSILLGGTAKIVADYILVGNPEINIYGAAAGAILNYIIVVSFELYFLCKETGAGKKLRPAVLKPFVSSLFSSAAAYFVYKNLSEGFSLPLAVNILSAVVSAAAVYFVFLISLKGISGEDLKMIPKGEKIAKPLEKFGLLG